MAAGAAGAAAQRAQRPGTDRGSCAGRPSVTRRARRRVRLISAGHVASRRPATRASAHCPHGAVAPQAVEGIDRSVAVGPVDAERVAAHEVHVLGDAGIGLAEDRETDSSSSRAAADRPAAAGACRPAGSAPRGSGTGPTRARAGGSRPRSAPGRGRSSGRTPCARRGRRPGRRRRGPAAAGEEPVGRPAAEAAQRRELLDDRRRWRPRTSASRSRAPATTARARSRMYSALRVEYFSARSSRTRARGEARRRPGTPTPSSPPDRHRACRSGARAARGTRRRTRG